MFEKIDTVDTVPARDLAGIRRRAAIRYRCHLASPVRLPAKDGSGTVRLAWVHNLSTHGIGLLVDESLESSESLEIDLFTPAGKKITAPSRLVHATRRADGSWLIGCAFVTALSADDLESLL